MLRDAWTLAIEALSWMELKRLSERLALNQVAQQLNISDANTISLAHMLVCETVRRQNLIDHVINRMLKPRSINDFKLGVRAFLRLYAYETVVEKCSFEHAVNIARMGRSVLGWRELREVEDVLGKLLKFPLDWVFKEQLTDEEKVGLSTFHPTWFVKYCFKLLGRKEALSFLESTAKVPPTYIRINTLREKSERKILESLRQDGIKLEKVKLLKHTYKVKETQHPLVRTPSFLKGLFYIQDKASCFATEVADPKPNMTVLDLCAAPGAKTTYLAQFMQNKGVIYSIDYSKRRMQVWKQEVERMGVKIAKPIVADLQNSVPLRIKADLIVLDPPCTSTGAFGKVPSAKWRITKHSVRRMAELQWTMLNNCAEHVKEGGFLVYSTCSITIEENEVLIERFLKWHPEFKLVETTPRMGVLALRGLHCCQRLYPHIHQCNGFFVARLQKTME